MMFVFAAMGDHASGWPVQLMHQTERAFVIVAFGSLLFGCFLKSILPYQLFALVGGVAAGFGLIMPFELAPFFFGARGEIMLGTMVLILAYPVAIIVFIFLFSTILKRV
jgi:thiosulfate dehydrogenase [quinone] large subunit